MSRLEERIRAGEFVVTAELLTIDTGGFDAVRERFEPYEEFVDAVNATDNTAAPPYEYRVERALKKVAAGARFFQLQVCFELAHLERFMREAVASGLAAQAALIPSICLVRTASALRFMDAKVPGISVPAAMIERVEVANEEEACFELGVETAERTLALPGV